jgi:RNA polymerase sigma factor FliA
MRLARRVPSNIHVEDLIGYGWVGLLESLSRSGGKMPAEQFEAYAAVRVRGAMLDHLRDLDPATRQTRAASRRATRAVAKLAGTLGRAPEEAEIAAEMRLTVEEYRTTLAVIGRTASARIDHVDIDTIDLPNVESRPQDEEADRRRLLAAVADATKQLPARLQHVLALYYQEDCNLAEVGAVLGVSESRISQLHTEAMHRLRASLGRE